MIIHIWMHWFWITTAYFKEAGLLANETFISTTAKPCCDSSQPGHDHNVTSPSVTEGRTRPPSTLQLLFSSSLQEETSAEESATEKHEDSSRTAFDSTSDVEDTYSGGNIDVLQSPLKKVTKYSHPKYGKVKTRGKTFEEEDEEQNKGGPLKVIEEKVTVNISSSHLGLEADNSSDRPFEGSASEASTSDDPHLITTTFTVENMTSEERGLGSRSKKTSNASMDSSDQKGGVGSLKNETLVIENKVETEQSGTFTTVEPFAIQNRVAAATSAHNYEVEPSEMNAGSITGIALGILVIFSLLGAVSFVLYRRRYLNKPQVLHDKCSNLDSSGYIDETSLRENSEEMYSLDNDSFLNSLEAMTIQNYWTESVKHTKL